MINKEIQDKPELSFDEIDSKIKELSVRKSLLVDEGLKSNDPHDILKAQDYLIKQEKTKKSQFKSFIYSPEHEFYNGMGYKSSLKSVSYDLMRAMARTPQINAIIQTRIEQVLNFSDFQTDLQREGWTIVKKLSRFDDHSQYDFTPQDKREIEKTVEFLENGGNNAKWDLADDFDEFLRKYVKDSLELDQACAVAGSLVELYDGTPCFIEDIKSGMNLRTHTGEVKRVLKSTSRRYSGELVTIKFRSQNLTVTEGHPVYASKRVSYKGDTVKLSNPEWIAAGDLTDEHFLIYPKHKGVDSDSHNIAIFDEEPRKYCFGDLDKLVKESKIHISNVKAILSGKKHKCSKSTVERILRLAKDIDVKYDYKGKYEDFTLMDKDWYYFIGLYLAEGSIQGNHVAISLHQKEINIIKFVEKFCKENKIGYNICNHTKNNGLSIFLHSKALSKFLLSYCSKGSKNKQIPIFVYKSSDYLVKQLLKGYFDGDAYIKNNSLSVQTTSKKLFNGLRILLSKYNIYLSESVWTPKQENWNDQYKSQIHGINYRKLAKELGYPNYDYDYEKNNVKWDNDYLYFKITSIESMEVEDIDVYNMEVEDDHSYVMEGFINHNCFEVERTRGNKINKFAAQPSDTFRILETIDPREFNKEKYKYDEVNGYLPIYAQTWRGRIAEREIPGTNKKEQIVFYPWELNLGIRNKSTNFRNNGYGKSELEILTEIITWMLYGMQYNGNFFKQGSNPKGFFTIEGDADADVVNEFRSAWRQTIMGIQNCIAGDTFILTDKGGIRIDKLFEKNNLDKDVNIWTGKKFERATAIMSGKKKLTKMTLNNGTSISCSPDHRFKVVAKDGVIKWTKRKDIKEGDFILVNKNQASLGDKLHYKEKEIETDLMEILGWMLGDGWIGEDKAKKRRGSLFYHNIKERWIAERHLNILKKYNINCYIDEHFYTENEKNRILKNYGFKSVAESNLRIYITDSDFYSFLYSIGFKSSKEGKNIPDFLYVIDSDYKNAFLRGLFSADGYSNGKIIHLSIVNNSLRNQVKQLLLSEGVRCNNHEGFSRYCSLGYQLQDGYRLLIKDRREFYNRIGFIQDYKNAKHNRTKSYRVLESIPQSLIDRYIVEIKKFQKKKYKLGERLRNSYLTSKISGIKTGKDKISKDSFISLCEQIGFDIEKDILDFNFEKVISLEDTKEIVQMYDISVYDREHQFIANGILTHNSHRIPIFEGQAKIGWQDMQHCLHGDSEVITKGNGNQSLLNILDGEDKCFTEIWDGIEFSKAKVFKTGEKQIMELVLNDRTSITTSPNHKFLVLRDNLPTWIERKDIVVGDYVFVNKKSVQGRDDSLKHKNKLVDIVNYLKVEQVLELKSSDEFVQMYDVEMFNHNHQFCANGMIVHNSNKDMEFENWNDFLLLIACSVYRIDPNEIGYTFKNKSQLFGQDGQKERIEHSKEKGLKPLLKFVQKQINKYIVSELSPGYQFMWTGIDLEDETAMLENDVKKSGAGFVSHEDMFEKYSNRKFDPDKDTILSPVYVQTKQMEQFGGVESNAAVDEMTGDNKKSPSNPNDNYEKGENPILDMSLDYIKKAYS